MARGKAGCAERSGLPRPNVPFGKGVIFFALFLIKQKKNKMKRLASGGAETPGKEVQYKKA
jgi:hypothetical protein